MTVAISAPDSVLAVAPRDAVDVGKLREALGSLSDTRIAIGVSTATLNGDVVDGDALDVESWAAWPLPEGLWVAETF
jgi:hypothetical protein